MVRRSLLAALPLALAAIAPAQSAFNIFLESRIPMPKCSLTDVYGIGEHGLVARRHLGFSVVDLSIPTAPTLVTIAPPGYPVSQGELGIGDIKADERYIYATSESVPAGVFIYDAGTNPMNPQFVGIVSDLRLQAGVHNCWVDGDTLYCSSNFSRRIEIYDVTDRTNPVWLASMGNEFGATLAHDVIVENGRAYCSFVFSGIAIYDVQDPSQPRLLGQHSYPGNATHNMWPSKDGNYLYTTDEIVTGGVGAPIRIFDISNLPAMVEVGTIKVGPNYSLPHNVYVREDMLFAAYFTEGVRVWDISDPVNPVEIGNYDTFASSGVGCWGAQSFGGCWGIYAFDHEHMLATDLDGGLYVLRMNLIPNAIFTVGAVTNKATIRFDYINRTQANLPSFGIVALTLVNGIPINVPLVTELRTLAPMERRRHILSFGPYAVPGPLVLDFASISGTLSPLLPSVTNWLKVRLQ